MGKPLGKIIEVEPLAKEMETKGFVISVNNEHMPELGKVLSIGIEVSDNVRVGDEILFRQGGYSKVKIENRDVLLMEEKMVYYNLSL